MVVVVEEEKLHSRLSRKELTTRSFVANNRTWSLILLIHGHHLGVFLKAETQASEAVAFKIALHVGEDRDSVVCKQEPNFKHFEMGQDRGWRDFIETQYLERFEATGKPFRFEIDIISATQNWNLLCRERYFEALATDAPECTQDELKGATMDIVNEILTEADPSSRVWRGEPSLYTGALGVAFMCLRLHKQGFSPINKPWLELCRDYIGRAERSDLNKSGMSFVLGGGGLLALHCALAEAKGDPAGAQAYLGELQRKEAEVLTEDSNEILYGKAGYLAALLFLEREVGLKPAVPLKVLRALLEEGQTLSRRVGSSCPLYYMWHRKPYMGFAHGFAGILTMLLHWRHELEPQEQKLVADSVHWFQAQALPSGNFPSKDDKEAEDELVHWCHGATGAIPLLAAAYRASGEPSLLTSAQRAATVVWERGLLRKGGGLCHGVAGSGYGLLVTFQTTGSEVYLRQARQFAKFMIGGAGERGGWRRLTRCGAMRVPDSRFSLFEGQAGLACFLLDLWSDPAKASMPC